MSVQAIRVLLEWAQKQDKGVQVKFCWFYQNYRNAYTNDEVMSGMFQGDRCITAFGMERMIEAFEGSLEE